MSSERSSSAVTAAETIEGNDDLLIEILLFVPPTSLVKFKVVNKRWRSLISAPFVLAAPHPRRRRESQSLFFLSSFTSKYAVYNPTIPKFVPFKFPFPFPKVKILQSCNGLLLLRCGKEDAEDEECRYYVFNPTTEQQRELSSLPRGALDSLYLMFDPSLSPHYRVVCFAFANAKNKTGTLIYVYDSKTHKWKLVGERKREASWFRNGIFFNGGIYIVRTGFYSSRFFLNNNVSSIPNPKPAIRIKKKYSMESNGFLLSLYLSWKGASGIIKVWERKAKERIWRKKHQVVLDPILATSGGKISGDSIHLLGVIRGEDEQDSLLLLSFRGKCIIYKFHDDVFEVDDYTSKEKERTLWFDEDCHNFIHTLAPV